MIKNRSKFPPGGWQYVQKGTNWRAPDNLSLVMLAQRVSQHRANHPELNASTDVSTIADEIDMYTCERLGWNPTWCNDQKKTIPGASSANQGNSTSQPASQGKGVVQRAVGVVKSVFSGGATIVEWLGEGGKPTPRPLAEERASVCLACPKHSKKWTFRMAIAAAIKRQVDAKQKMKLEVQNESKLGACSVCECHLGLKVWVPLAHILNHTPDSVMKDFPPNCWIPAEKKSLQSASESPWQIPSGHFHSSD